jgi:hypothetical protein
MADALPVYSDRPGVDFQPPPPRSRIQIEAPPPGPTPTQIRSVPPTVGHMQTNKPNWIRRDPPPHFDQRGPSSNSNSNAIAIAVRPRSGQDQYQYPLGPPPPRFQEIPSTTFHVGPIPPTFTIHQIHQAINTFNPKVAMLDLRSGVMEIEIPFTLTWAQIGDCKFFSSLFFPCDWNILR